MMKRFVISVLTVLLLGAMACQEDDNFLKPVVIAPSNYTYASSGALDGHDYVDLGLSVKWATLNVGASSPDESGIYVSWGECDEKESYTWDTYSNCEKFTHKLYNYVYQLEYSAFQKLEYLDYKTRLDLYDDAAHVNWGGNWRMPSDEEITELRTKCKFEWCSVNEKNGYKITGPSGNSIFVPAAGFRVNKTVDMVGRNGCFWSRNLSSSSSMNAYEFSFFDGSLIRGSVERFYGACIRAVYDESLAADDDDFYYDDEQGDDDPEADDDETPVSGDSEE